MAQPKPVSQPPGGIQEDHANRQAQVYEGEYIPLTRLRERKVGKEEQEQYQATHPRYPAREYQEYGEEGHRSGQEKLGCLPSVQEEAEGLTGRRAEDQDYAAHEQRELVDLGRYEGGDARQWVGSETEQDGNYFCSKPFPKGHL